MGEQRDPIVFSEMNQTTLEIWSRTQRTPAEVRQMIDRAFALGEAAAVREATAPLLAEIDRLEQHIRIMHDIADQRDEIISERDVLIAAQQAENKRLLARCMTAGQMQREREKMWEPRRRSDGAHVDFFAEQARSATESAQDGDRREREVRRECHCPAEEHDFGCFHAWSNADSGLDGA